MREIGSSPGRSAHQSGIAASRIVADAREKLASLFNVHDSAHVVFTLNCTEALNLALKGTLKAGDHVVTTSVEHNAVMRPLTALTADLGITVTKARANSDSMTDPASVEESIRSNTALIVMTHASNVTGAIQPIAECASIAHAHGIPMLVDTAQSAGCLPIDMQGLGVDMLAFSGHKGLLGPQGVGGLALGPGQLPTPLKQGGTGSDSREEKQPTILPDKYESGTPNSPGIAGLSAALDFLAEQTIPAVRHKMLTTGRLMIDGMNDVKGLTLHGPDTMEENVGVFSFTVAGHDAGTLAHKLEDKHGIMTRVGLQCAPAAHKTIGTYPDGTIRASIGYFTTEQDVAYFLESLRATVD